MIIFLKFTSTTKYRHPHMLAAVGNYLRTCNDLKMAPAEIQKHLEEASRDANMEPAVFQKILRDAR